MADAHAKSVTLVGEEKTALAQALRTYTRAMSIYQAGEMRLRADALDAEREKNERLVDIARAHGLDPALPMEFDQETGVLTQAPAPAPTPAP